MPTTRAPSLLSLALLSFSVAGCGGAESSPDPEAPAPARFEAGPFTVEPGEELVMCTYARDTNDVPADVTAFETEQSAGGHHLIVYTVDHAVDLPPSPCSQGGQPSWTQIAVSQKHEERQSFPEGVGFRVAARQQYVLETHYINTSSEPLVVESAFTARFAAPGEVSQRAATYFFGAMNIDVAPGSEASSSVECAPPEPMVLRTMFGHQHRHGTGVSVDMMTGGTPQRLYQATDWEDPPVETFDGGRAVTAPDTVRVACDWKNDGTDVLRYPHEMCFAIGYYWPAEAGVFCASGGGTDACQCRYQGTDDAGPGGAGVEVSVTRADVVHGAGGALDEGAPIYCALYRAEDWAAIVPKTGAQPAYFRDAIDVRLESSSDEAKIEIADVTPGEYAVTCMMDTIGGGFLVGSGDVVNLDAPRITVTAGQTTRVETKLDFAVP